MTTGSTLDTTVRVNGPFLHTTTTKPASEQPAPSPTLTNSATITAQLSKIEQVLEYLKALYR